MRGPARRSAGGLHVHFRRLLGFDQRRRRFQRKHPSSTAQADTGKLTPNLDEDENSIFSIQNTEAAFAPCLGWGPGVSGCSLKSVIAAASLLGWAESGNLAMRSTDAIQDAYTTWFNDLSADDQASFADAWPSSREDANTLLTDKASMEGRISDAGLNAKKAARLPKENWESFCREGVCWCRPPHLPY